MKFAKPIIFTIVVLAVVGLGLSVVNQIIDNNDLRIIDIRANYDQVTFELDYIERDVEITSITLYEGNTTVDTTNVNLLTFSNLKSDTKYRIEVKHTGGWIFNNTKATAVTFTTQKLTVPKLEDVVIRKNHNSVVFNVEILDPDQILSFDSILLYDSSSNALISEISSSDRSFFSNLFSDTEYRLEFYYEYNLLDGKGRQQLKKTETFKTTKVSIPDIILSILETGKRSVEFKINIYDNNNVGEIIKFEIYEKQSFIQSIFNDETLIKSSIDKDTRYFIDLVPNTEYVLVVTYRYDLYDGNGEISKTYTIDFKTQT